MPGKNNSPLVSICCLGYNHGQFMRDNITAIWNDPYKNVEIIVVDDGSSDDSGVILKQMAKQSPCPMHVILQKNTGNIGHNFNVAMKHAKGDIISFIALDDVLKPTAIDITVKLMNSDKNTALVAASAIEAIDSEGNVSNNVPALALHSMTSPTLDDLLELEYSKFGAFYIQGAFFRKKLIDAIGGFDEDMTGDDIVLRAKVFRYMQKHPSLTFKIVDTPLCQYRQHGSNVHLNIKRQIKIVTEYLGRYWPDRPNPKELVEWAEYGVRSKSFDDALGLFAMNARAAELLNEESIRKLLREKLRKEMRLSRYIFKKERNGNARKITLFSCIKISYTKKRKK